MLVAVAMIVVLLFFPKGLASVAPTALERRRIKRYRSESREYKRARVVPMNTKNETALPPTSLDRWT